MKFLTAFLIPFLAVGAFALEGFDEEAPTREKYISLSPEELPPQNLIFDHRGKPTLALKDEKKGKEAKKKKKKKKEKRKKLTKKPGKRRPKGWGKSKNKARKTQKKKKRKKRSPPPREKAPDADEPPDAPKDDGQGFDYGGVNVGDDAKVAIPGGSGPGGGPSFRPAPPRAQ